MTTAETDNRRTALAADLLSVTAKLNETMREEIGILDQPRMPNLQKLIDDKNTLVSLYRSRIQAIRSDSDFSKAVDPILREKLRRNMAALAEIADLLNIKLMRRRKINEGIIQAIGTHAAEKSAPVQGYGKDGLRRTLTPHPHSVARPASIALNQAV